MNFATKLKQIVFIGIILIFTYYLAGSMFSDSFNTSMWSKTTKYYFIYGSIITIGWLGIYSIDEKKSKK